jgi:predicted transcriptional regulator of viral defense system
MNKYKKTLGELSSRFFAYVQLKKKEIIRIGELAAVLNISPSQERNLLYRLSDVGWIVRLKRGVYLVPDRLPAGGKYNPGTSIIIDKLMVEYGGNYQITGPSAFYFYGFDDQIPNIFYIYNDKISGNRRIGNQTFQFIKILDERLGAIKEVATPQGANLKYSSKARTLVDAVYDWSRFNSLPRGYKWIKDEISMDSKFETKLVETTIRYGNQATIRRIGYLLDPIDKNRNNKNLLMQLSKTKSLIPWIPNKKARGKINRKWGLIVNE